MNKTISNPEIEKLLENRGWVIECFGPLEISHPEREAFASRYAAEVVIEEVVYDTIEGIIGKKVDDWHNNYTPNIELHAHLGLTAQEYRNWVSNPRSLSGESMTRLVKEYNESPTLFEDYL